MKKSIILLMAFILAFSLFACSSSQKATEASTSNHSPSSNASTTSELSLNTETASSDEASENTDKANEEKSKILIAYFSWADNAIIEGEVDAVASPSVTAPGYVAQLASWVQEETGGDLFSIQVTEPYSSDWDECLDRANQERSQNARPELTETVENIDDYQVVFLGYPNWWYGAPMALLSFIEENDLSNKQIYLFCSHGTGGLAGSVEDIEGVLPDNVTLSDNIFDVYEEDASESQNDIVDWLSELNV